jgi:hypothetical protein
MPYDEPSVKVTITLYMTVPAWYGDADLVQLGREVSREVGREHKAVGEIVEDWEVVKDSDSTTDSSR